MTTKEKKIGISKITIQMGEKEATLTVEQARELQAALNALLGEKVIERVIEKEARPHWWYIYPHTVYGNVSGTLTTTGNAVGDYTIKLSGDGDLLPVA